MIRILSQRSWDLSSAETTCSKPAHSRPERRALGLHRPERRAPGLHSRPERSNSSRSSKTSEPSGPPTGGDGSTSLRNRRPPHSTSELHSTSALRSTSERHKPERRAPGLHSRPERSSSSRSSKTSGPSGPPTGGDGSTFLRNRNRRPLHSTWEL